jgi:hypothetical protein
MSAKNLVGSFIKESINCEIRTRSKKNNNNNKTKESSYDIPFFAALKI